MPTCNMLIKSHEARARTFEVQEPNAFPLLRSCVVLDLGLGEDLLRWQYGDLGVGQKGKQCVAKCQEMRNPRQCSGPKTTGIPAVGGGKEETATTTPQVVGVPPP